MAGFIRRFGFNPGSETLTQIEGVVIVDAAPPASIAGVSVGMACIVGEFADCSYAVQVDGTGTVTESIQPQEVFSAADFYNKAGGWDETIGDFGDSGGNGYVDIYGKRFSRLIVAPVNLTSARGCRFFRELPLCFSATVALPAVPISGGNVAAGREFSSSGGGRLRTASPVLFTALDIITSGVAGATNVGVAAATQTFTVAGFDWSTITRPEGGQGAKVGDILVIGNNSAGARVPAAEAGTYRVQATPASGTTITLEALDGNDFAFTAQTAVPWRLHVSSDADSAPVVVVGATVAGGYAAGSAGGCSVPVRPLTNTTGVAADGDWAADTDLTPAIVPSAATGSSWDPLSGLGGFTHATAVVSFDLSTQGPNAPADASLDALYQTAITATLSDLDPIRSINIIWAARTSSTIRTALRQNAIDASATSAGRVDIVTPELDVTSTAAAIADTSPGVGATRGERTIYAWPGYITSIPAAVDTRLKTADALTTIDGLLDMRSDSLAASLLSNLPPELNPGQAQEPVPSVMASVLGIQRGVTSMTMNDFIALRSRGVMGLRLDPDTGPVFQSGITSSLTSGQKNIARRRMADFIQDSLARAMKQYAKSANTQENRDNQLAAATDFMEGLLSVTNPAAQRIEEYSIDERSGNTPASLAKGINVLIVRARTIASQDVIVLQTEIGNNVVVTNDLA